MLPATSDRLWGDFDVTVAGWITTGEGPDIVYLGSEYAATYGLTCSSISIPISRTGKRWSQSPSRRQSIP